MTKITVLAVPAALAAFVALVPQASAQMPQSKPVYMSTRKMTVSVHKTAIHKVTKTTSHSSLTVKKSSKSVSSHSSNHYTGVRQTIELQLPTGTQESSNWSGYVVTPATGSPKYTSITGSWIVPKASGSASSLGSQWIGLGGVNSSDLLQMGTIEQFQRNREVVTLFWEQLPDAAQNLVTVPVGSHITATISTQDGTDYSLTFQVVEPNGQTVTQNVSTTLSSEYAAGIGTSAEWISEDPSTANGGLYPLANTGSVEFTDAMANNAPINVASNQVQPLALVDSSREVRIAPTTLYPDGTSFSTISIGGQSVSWGNRRYWHEFRPRTRGFYWNSRW